MELTTEVKIQVIERGKELLTTMGWTQAASARDKDGNICDPISSNACCFCMTGALVRALFEICAIDWHADNSTFLHEIKPVMRSALPYGRMLVEFNDAEFRQLKMVLYVFDRALLALRRPNEVNEV